MCLIKLEAAQFVGDILVGILPLEENYKTY